MGKPGMGVRNGGSACGEIYRVWQLGGAGARLQEIGGEWRESQRGGLCSFL